MSRLEKEMTVKADTMTKAEHSVILSRIGIRCNKCQKKVTVGDRITTITPLSYKRIYHTKCYEALML
jgi:hypothetical protein